MDKIRIVIIDDHKMIREGLRQLLELEGDIEVVGEAGNGFEGIEIIEETNPDVILLDINMPRMNGVEMIKKMINKNNIKKILVLTIHNEIEYLERVIKYGVSGYILKDSEYSILKKAIISVYNGNSYIQPSLAPLLRENLKKEDSTKKMLESLSTREIEVLKLISRGMVNREIADELQISEKTVKNHVANIFRKIEVKDRTQAAVLAIKYNIVEI